jgi:hypothetical protein
LAAFDLDWQERAVFDLVRQVQYYSGIINMPNSSRGRFSRLLKLTGEQQQQQQQCVVPVWLIILFDQLLIVALEELYPLVDLVQHVHHCS